MKAFRLTAYRATGVFLRERFYVNLPKLLSAAQKDWDLTPEQLAKLEVDCVDMVHPLESAIQLGWDEINIEE